MFAANASGPGAVGNNGGPNGMGSPSRIDHSAGRGPGLRHVLAGLQAGVLGALLIFVCLMLGSLWNGRSIWVAPNLFATTFYGSDVYRNQLLHTSWTGIALIVAMYGALGMLWGCIWRDERVRWIGLYGVVAGICIYFLFFDVLWRHVNPLITLYAPDRQLQVGHVLFGLALARSPLYARRIEDSISKQPTTQQGVYEVAAQEVSSGDAIR